VRIDALVLGSQRAAATAKLDNKPGIRRQTIQEIRVDTIIILAQDHDCFSLAVARDGFNQDGNLHGWSSQWSA
jgi:hypothetical protein